MNDFKDKKFTPDFKVLDDVARVAGGAVNVISAMQQQIRDDVKARFEEFAARMDLVPREDLDQAQAQINELRSRLDEIEAKLDALAETGAKNKAAPKKNAAKNRSTKTSKTK